MSAPQVVADKQWCVLAARSSQGGSLSLGPWEESINQLQQLTPACWVGWWEWDSIQVGERENDEGHVAETS